MKQCFNPGLLVVLLFAGGFATATACEMDGQNYREGAFVGDRVCVNGGWVARDGTAEKGRERTNPPEGGQGAATEKKTTEK